MSKAKILVVEDEDDIQELVRHTLVKEGYGVDMVESGEEGMKRLAESPPDLVVLDLMLPGIGGLEVCRRIKSQEAIAGIPVIMLTARGTEADVVTGLEMGADDYVTKPFSPRVLAARVGAVLRRRATPPSDEGAVLRAGAIEIHPGRHEVRVDGQAVELTFTEYGILAFLVRHPGWVFTRYQIVDAVRGANHPVTERSVDVQVVGLRKKLGAEGRRIETVRGVGYRMRD